MFKYFLKFVFGVYNLIKENKTIEIIEIAENNLEDSKSDIILINKVFRIKDYRIDFYMSA